MNEFRVLVCGGRDYGVQIVDGQRVPFQPEIDHIYHILDLLFKSTSRPITIIHGAARGADQISGEWAKDRNVDVVEFPADWDQYKQRAGYIRNKQMLDEGRPHLVVAFPGGVGTRMMVRLAKSTNVPVREFYPSWLTSKQD